MVESAATTGSRVAAIDASRGAAMLFVCLSHFAEVYLRRNAMPADWAIGLSMVASPTFMLVSGCLLGFFSVTRRERFAATVLSYAGRGLFLLTVGRLIILVAHVALAGGVWRALHWAFITDAIGVCLLVGPAIVARASAGARAVAAAVLFGLSWFFVLVWRPTSPLGRVIEETLYGPNGPYGTHWYADVFPLVPWVAIFLLGTCFGDRLARLPAGDRPARTALAARWSGAFLLSGAAAWLAGRGLAQAGVARVALGHGFFSPFRKLPPSPVYVAVYGGIGLAILAFLLWSEPWAVLPRLRSALEVLGRNSLLAFMTGYFVYFTALVVADMGYTPLWPALFVLTVAIVFLVALAWDRTGWNRHLTLKVPLAMQHVLARVSGFRPGGR